MVRAVVLAGGLLAACGGSSKSAATPIENKPATVAEEPPPPQPTDVERAFATFAELEKAMCACTDADCANRISGELTKWSEATAAAPPKMTPAEEQRAIEFATRMVECMQKASGM